MNRGSHWLRRYLTVSALWPSAAIALTLTPADARAFAPTGLDGDVLSAFHGSRAGQRTAQDLGNEKIPGGVENTPSAGGAMPPPAAMPAPPPPPAMMPASPALPRQIEPLPDNAKDKKSRGSTQGKDKDKKSGGNDPDSQDDTTSKKASKSSTPAHRQLPASAPVTRGLTRGLTTELPKPPEGADEGQPGGVELMPSHE